MEIVNNISTINLFSILIALIGFAAVIFIPKMFPRVPVLLVALIVPTIISVLIFPGKVATIGSAFGGISQSLPVFSIPEFTFDKLLYLWQPAFVIAMLGGIESLLSAVVADGMTGKQHRSNKELFGQGLANIITPLFGGIPATGAIARTATNINSGAVSPWSGIFQSIFVLLTLLLFAPYASHIPLASMAPILMVVAYNMSETKSFAHIIKLRSGDSLVLLTTFLLTVFVNLTVAVPAGLLLAVLSFVKRASSVLEVGKFKIDDSTDNATEDKLSSNECPEIASFTIQGPLFFGAADRFESALMHSINERHSVLILKMKSVPLIDATAEANLSALIDDFVNLGGTVLITELPEEPLNMLKRSGLYESIGSEFFFNNTIEAINYALNLVDVENCSVCSAKGATSCQVFKKINYE